MKKVSRRNFVVQSGVALGAAGSFAQVRASTGRAHARAGRPNAGYGPLVADPAGIIDLPAGFHYRVFSRVGETLSSGGLVPASHDGMGAFWAGPLGTLLVRNHELEPEDIEEDDLVPVRPVKGATYDPEAPGGTSTLLVSPDRRLLRHGISLAGTANNCGGGRTPWGTWLTCEEIVDTFSKPHGYVFEVDPLFGGNPRPIEGMGRLEHEAVAFARNGTAFLTEDAGEPFGCLYRFVPRRPLAGRGSLHAGGVLTAAALAGVDGDLSQIKDPGTVLDVRWVSVANPNPGDSDAQVREQALSEGATPIMKAEGVWTGEDGSIWFVSSYAGGPNAEDFEDVTVAAHAGQIWKLDPRRNTMELVVQFAPDSPYDGPDNITVSPHGFALACTDGEDDQWLVGINEAGETFPFAFNALSDSEFAGATFSPDGDTLFVNIQSDGLTLAIWGPWHKGRRG
ncbi:MAG TPA: alkaline phosphatase PhoX [Polyangiales bacterium]